MCIRDSALLAQRADDLARLVRRDPPGDPEDDLLARERGHLPASSPVKNGFPRISSPTVVTGPCPGKRMVSPGNVKIFSRTERSSSSSEPPGRSVRPMDPSKMRSPTKARSPERYVTCPGVCPGVWRTRNATSPRVTVSPSRTSTCLLYTSDAAD